MQLCYIYMIMYGRMIVWPKFSLAKSLDPYTKKLLKELPLSPTPPHNVAFEFESAENLTIKWW